MAISVIPNLVFGGEFTVVTPLFDERISHVGLFVDGLDSPIGRWALPPFRCGFGCALANVVVVAIAPTAAIVVAPHGCNGFDLAVWLGMGFL